jgi:hypothetical protein
MLCSGAAAFNKLALLQWLHSHSCPWHEELVLHYAGSCGSIAMLEWLQTATAPWSCDTKQDMLTDAGCHNELDVVKWLRDQGAIWPVAFTLCIQYTDRTLQKCWSVSAVQWALACGSGWLEWDCEDYAADKYSHAHYQKQAAELLEWAHANRCPCTCEHAQQQ